MDKLPWIVFLSAFALPVGFGLGLRFLLLLGIDLPKAVGAMLACRRESEE